MKPNTTNALKLIGVGLTAGLGLSAIDNFAFQGEVSPIMIVVLLLIVTVLSGANYAWRGWFIALSAWFCLPLAHIVKHVLGLPDTLQPNTYASILMLALFTLAVAAIGITSGIFLRRLKSE